MSEGFGFNMSYTAIFEKATADYDCSRGKEALKLYQPGKAPATITFGDEDGYVGELRHAIESILNGKAPSIVTAKDGVRAIEICEAEEKSVYSRQIVNL